MSERVFGWWVLASLGAHVVGIVAVASLDASVDLSPRAAVAIEIVRLPAPEPPPPPPPPPRAKPAPPRVVEPAPAPKVADATPQLTPNLLEAPAPPRPSPMLAGSLAPSALPSAPAPVVGGPAGVGRLFAGGDLLVAPGPSSEGGSGAPGPRGQGLAAAGATSSNMLGSGTGLTKLAVPLGGYQVKPSYPERARRDGAEGVTHLRVEVLETGRVGDVTVKRSAGHRDLDRAAIEAVKQWQFEPARRGAAPVAVGVELDFRFSLSELR